MSGMFWPPPSDPSWPDLDEELERAIRRMVLGAVLASGLFWTVVVLLVECGR